MFRLVVLCLTKMHFNFGFSKLKQHCWEDYLTHCNDPRRCRCVSLLQSPCVSCCRLLEAQEECQQLRKTIAGTRKRAASEADRLASRDLY